MRDTEFAIKQNDTSPALEVELQDNDENAIDLSGASAEFHMVEKDGDTVAVDSSATITDGSNGIVEYQWSSGDTSDAGRYLAEFEITYSDGTIETFPNNDDIVIRIMADLA